MEDIDIDAFIIKKAAEDVPEEHIRFFLKEKGIDIPLETVMKLIEKNREDIRIKKEILNSSKKQRIGDLIVKLDTIVDNLFYIIEKAKEKNTKTAISAIQQINASIMNLARLINELKNQQEAEVSNYYIPVNDVISFIRELIKDFPKEVQKKLLKKLNAAEIKVS